MRRYRVREDNDRFMACIEHDGKMLDMAIFATKELAQEAKDIAEAGMWDDFGQSKPKKAVHKPKKGD